MTNYYDNLAAVRGWNFAGKGYATEANAQKLLLKYATLLEESDATTFIAVQNNRFHPVAHIRKAHAAFALANGGIVVLN